MLIKKKSEICTYKKWRVQRYITSTKPCENSYTYTQHPGPIHITDTYLYTYLSNQHI